MNSLNEIHALIQRGALFVVNHSGGKDSQAMLNKVRRLVPEHRILVIHANLPGVEWEGTEAHVYRYLGAIRGITCTAVKTFFEMVRHRGMFPSPKYRQCTSDLKRGPIEKTIRNYLKAHPCFRGLVVNCMGLRAEESASRSKAVVFKFNVRNSKAGREWYDWLPIQEMTTEEVFQNIRAHGQQPHWAYAAGMTRLSCCFCIMSSQADIETAARLNPKLYREICELESEVNHTMMMPRKDEQPRFLNEIAGIPIVASAGQKAA